MYIYNANVITMAEKNYENSKKLFCDIFAFEVPSA